MLFFFTQCCRNLEQARSAAFPPFVHRPLNFLSLSLCRRWDCGRRRLLSSRAPTLRLSLRWRWERGVVSFVPRAGPSTSFRPFLSCSSPVQFLGLVHLLDFMDGNIFFGSLQESGTSKLRSLPSVPPWSLLPLRSALQVLVFLHCFVLLPHRDLLLVSFFFRFCGLPLCCIVAGVPMDSASPVLDLCFDDCCPVPVGLLVWIWAINEFRSPCLWGPLPPTHSVVQAAPCRYVLMRFLLLLLCFCDYFIFMFPLVRTVCS